jgi:hypothetical protein
VVAHHCGDHITQLLDRGDFVDGRLLELTPSLRA